MTVNKFFIDLGKYVMPNTRTFFQEIKERAIGAMHKEVFWKAKFSKEGIKNYLDNLRSINGICHAHGIRVINVFQPNLAFKKSLAEYEKEILKFITDRIEGYLEVIHRFYEETSRVFERELSVFVKENDVVDLSGIFLNNPDEIYSDYCHYNKEGNSIIARALAKIIAGK